MTSVGRGRGYTGRHHLREDSQRPGEDKSDPAKTVDLDLVKKLTDMIPQSPESQTEVKVDSKTEDLEDSFGDIDQGLKELLYIDEKYQPLLVLLEQFSPGEDGIQFNRKLRQFESTVTSMCSDDNGLVQAFATFRAAALASACTSRKLAAVGASFTRQQRQQLLRSTLLNVVMQGTFSKLDILERSNPQFLINAANLMGDYFAEARLCNGNKVHILAAPLLHYMKSLLASNDIRAHRSLATQLMQNGRELLSVLSQELDELSISIRIRLLSPPPVSIIWLLLSADLCLNKFLPLPNTLQQFYASHLELTQEEQNQSYSEVSYGSWKKSPEREDFRGLSLGEANSDLNISADKLNQSIGQLNVSHDDSLDTMKPKLRPILGAGAGLLRQEALNHNHGLAACQDNFDTWTASSKGALTKRYDLNSWRQSDDEKKEVVEEPVFNPSILPPNLTSFPQSVTVPDYPPPGVNQRFVQNSFATPSTETFAPANYLQQGDSVFIQNQFNETFPNSNPPFSAQGDGVFVATQFQNQVEKLAPNPNSNVAVVQNEFQKSASVERSKRSVENWRKEKSDLKEQDLNRNRQKSWSRQRSKDNLTDGSENDEKREGYRSTSRNSREGKTPRPSRKKEETPEPQKPVRRHVTEVPRSQKYWDHDDRCDKDYNS